MCLGHTHKRRRTSGSARGRGEEGLRQGASGRYSKINAQRAGNLFVLLVRNELNILKFAYAKGKE